MTKNAIFSSKSDLWGTPPEVFRMLDQFLDFQLDAASTNKNALCKNHFTKSDDGLKQDWHPFRRVWLNPPYGRPIGLWMEKAFRESQKGCLVVCLVPARVDTKWWHDWVENRAYYAFPKGRLRYLNYTDGSASRSGSAPFASALVVYAPDLENRFLFSTLPIERKCVGPSWLERKCILPGYPSVQSRLGVWRESRGSN